MNGNSCRFDVRSGMRSFFLWNEIFLLVTEYIDLNFVQVFEPWNLDESHRHIEVANWLMCHWIRTRCFWVHSQSQSDNFKQTLRISQMPRNKRGSDCYLPDSLCSTGNSYFEGLLAVQGRINLELGRRKLVKRKGHWSLWASTHFREK